MLLEDLKNRFKLEKDSNPLHINELLDFLTKAYIQGDLTISQYKKGFSELHKLKAEKPHSFLVQISSYKMINIPS